MISARLAAFLFLFFRIVAQALFLVYALLVVGCIVVHLGLVPSGGLLQGLSFTPWIYVALASGVISLLLLVGHRYLWSATTVVLLAVYFFVCGDWLWRRPAPTTESTAFSVVTLNLQYFKKGVKKVAETIRDMNADVFLLSEVTLSRSDLRKFRSTLGEWSFYMGKQYETAIASRLPIEGVEEVELPAHQASLSIGNKVEEQHFNPPRSFLHARIRVNGHLVHVISVRFIAGRPADNSLSQNLAWGKYLLETQSREVQFLREYVEKLEGPVVFGGDLNATPSSFIIRSIAPWARDSYLDTHMFGKSTFPTYTRPGFRLDYIFHRGGLAVTRSEVVPAVTSDHFPVRSEFAFAQ